MPIKRRRRKTRGPGLVATLRDPDKIRVAYMIAGLALVFGGSLGFGAAQCGSPQTARTSRAQIAPTDAIAEIEGRKITYYDYGREYESTRRRVDASGERILMSPDDEAMLKYQVLRQLIDMQYFDLRAKEAGIEVTDAQMEERLDSYRTQLLPPKTPEEDRSLLQRFMESLGSVKEEKAFENKLRELDPTLTLSRLQTRIRQQLLAEQYVAKLTSDKEQEIMDELTTRANEIRDEIVGGREFQSAALEYSDHQDSSGAGGLVPLVKHDSEKLPQAVIDSSFSLPLGEVSLPIPVREPDYRGVWLLTVISRRDASGEAWESTRESLYAQLLEEKRAKVEAGELELPPDGNLTVSDEEVEAAYEEATVRVIYLKAEDSMRRVSEAVRTDEDTLNIAINEPELRATHHMFNKNWDLAAACYFESLQDLAERYGDLTEEDRYAYDMEVGRIRYLIGNLWSMRGRQLEVDWYTPIVQQFQTNPDAFGGQFPELPDEVRTEQQGYFVLALRNVDLAVQLEGTSPFYRLQRSQIDLGRQQMGPRVTGDLEIAHLNSSGDFNVESRVLSTLDLARSLDDTALQEAGGTRPETWTDPVFPEDEMQLKLEDLDAPFIAQIDFARQATRQADLEGRHDSEASESVDEGQTDESVVETEGIDAPVEPIEPAEAGDGENAAPETVATEHKAPDWIPIVPIPEPTGPLTAEQRQHLDNLYAEVKARVDEMTAQKEAVDAERRAMLEEQMSQLQQTAPEEGAPPEGAENLIDEENQDQ